MIIHHPKVIISPQKCPFFPQKPHLFNIFTLKNDLRTYVENCRESHLREIMGQIAQDAWIRGTAVRLHVYLVFVKSIEQELKIQ